METDPLDGIDIIPLGESNLENILITYTGIVGKDYVWNLSTLSEFPEIISIDGLYSPVVVRDKNKQFKILFEGYKNKKDPKFVLELNNNVRLRKIGPDLKAEGYVRVSDDELFENELQIIVGVIDSYNQNFSSTGLHHLGHVRPLYLHLKKIKDIFEINKYEEYVMSSYLIAGANKAPITFMALGTGNLDSQNRPNTCFALELDNGVRYYVDFPKDMHKAGDLSKVQNIILTHDHPDHKGDLESLLYEKAYKLNEKVNLITTEKIFNDVTDKLNDDVKAAINFIDVLPNKVHELPGGLQIETRWNTHGDSSTIGLKLNYKNKVLGYSSDHKFNSTSYTKELDNLNLFYKFAKKVDSEGLNIKGDKSKKDFRDGIDDAMVAAYMAQIMQISEKVARCALDLFMNHDLDARGMKPACMLWPTAAGSLSEMVQNVIMSYSRKNVLWFKDCDIILHEATNNPNDPVHTHIGELEKLPEEIRNKMYIVHTPDNFKCPEGLKLLEPMRKYRLV